MRCPKCSGELKYYQADPCEGNLEGYTCWKCEIDYDPWVLSEINSLRERLEEAESVVDTVINNFGSRYSTDDVSPSIMARQYRAKYPAEEKA